MVVDQAAIYQWLYRKKLGPRTVILGSLVSGALYTWFAGEDVNWDWLNYHEYTAFALLNGRFETDVAPGGFQTFLNPVVYVPAYLLRHYIGPPSWGILLGAIHGLNLALVWWISRLLLGSGASNWTILASMVIAGFGPMTLSEVGTSFADVLSALPLLAGLGVMMSAKEGRGGGFVIAGLLAGVAVGLKLTNAVFLIGIGISLLAVDRPLLAMASLAAGSATGILVTGGPWAWMLWEQFGNPVFPFFNTIFRSPRSSTGADHRHAFYAARAAGRGGLSVLLAGWGSSFIGNGVPRSALCSADRPLCVDSWREPVSQYPGFPPAGQPIPAILRSLLWRMACDLFDPSLRDCARIDGGAAYRAFADTVGRSAVRSDRTSDLVCH
jgi:hypothetical protein